MLVYWVRLTPLPPLAEQYRIVAKVQKMQQQLSQLEAQVQQSRQYAQQLLQAVLKGFFSIAFEAARVLRIWNRRKAQLLNQMKLFSQINPKTWKVY